MRATLKLTLTDDIVLDRDDDGKPIKKIVEAEDQLDLNMGVSWDEFKQSLTNIVSMSLNSIYEKVRVEMENRTKFELDKYTLAKEEAKRKADEAKQAEEAKKAATPQQAEPAQTQELMKA